MKQRRRGVLLSGLPAMALAFVLLHTAVSTQPTEEAENSDVGNIYEEVFSAVNPANPAEVYIQWDLLKSAASAEQPELNQANWFLGAYKSDSGSLLIALNRSVLNNDLICVNRYFAEPDASLNVQLLDIYGDVVLANLSGNLSSEPDAGLVLSLAVPLAAWTNAAVINLQGQRGATRVAESLIYIDQSGAGGAARKSGQQLQASDDHADSDRDGISDDDETFRYGTDSARVDTDSDGMSDRWEISHGLNPLFNDGSGDPDNDGLTNRQEYQHETDPQNADTDGDGMPDGWEVAHHLNPWVNNAARDPDNDGLTNLQEYQYGIDPFNPDTDGDGMRDWDELLNASSPSSSNTSLPFVEYFEPDTVQVGLLHGQNNWEAFPTNSALVQTDIVYQGTQALALSYNTEAEVRHLFVSTNRVVWLDVMWLVEPSYVVAPAAGSVTAASAWYFNSAGRLVVYDGLAGAGGAWVTLTNHAPFNTAQWARVVARLDYDTRRWGVILNGAVLATNLGFSATAPDYFSAIAVRGRRAWADNLAVSLTQPVIENLDWDGDGMWDSWETAHGLDPTLNDAALDPDNDGLTNLQEFQIGSDPHNVDSDADGIRDGDETRYGYSPISSNAYSRLDFAEYFEPDTVQVGLLHGQNNWEVFPADGALVQTNIIYEGAQALALAGDAATEVRHLFAGAGRVIWLDAAWLTEPSYTVAPTGTVTAAAAWFFDPAGRLVVYDGSAGAGGGWVTLTNHTPIKMAQWARVVARLDYDTRRWGVILNGAVLATNLGFSATAPDYFTAIALRGRRAWADNVAVSLTQPVIENLDLDGDGMADSWETAHGLDPTLNDAALDLDNDGLTNLQEFQYGTDPRNVDTDGDGLRDGDEARYGYDPAISNAYSRLDFAEYFEPDTVQVGLLHGQNNWEVFPADSALVQTNMVFEGTQALALAGNAATEVRHLFVGAGREIWLDVAWLAEPSYTVAPTGSVTAAAAWFFDSAGRLVVYDGLAGAGGGWVTLTNHAPLTTAQWVRVVARLDYDTRRWGVILNGAVLATNLGFSATAPDYFSAIALRGKRAWADNVAVWLTQPVIENLDSDNDGMWDSWEAAQGFDLNDPADAGGDADGDGLTNLREFQYGSDPHNTDTDGDGMPDGWEVAHGFDPLVNDAALDADNDALTNLQEYQYGTDPNNTDTDGDGMSDGWEVSYSLNPLDAADASPDPDNDWLSNLQEYQNGSAPFNADTDADHLFDGYEVIYSQTDPANADTDADSLNDWWEVRYGMPPLSFDDPSADPDGDTLSHSQEEPALLNPLNADSDGDGLPDAWEIVHGLTPAAGERYSLVSWWRCDDPSGSYLDDDSRIWSNTGVLLNGATHLAQGWNGRSLAFDGGYDYSFVPGNFSLNSLNAMTLAFWVNLSAIDDPNTPIAFVAQQDSAGQIAFSLTWLPSAGSLRFTHVNAAHQSETVSVACSLPVNTWTHLAVAVSNNQVSFFVNGAQQGATQTLSFPRSTGGDLFFGSPGYGLAGAVSPNGLLDEIRLYNEKLSVADLAALFEALADPDGDGLNNREEFEYGTDPNADDRLLDSDGDGLSNYDEVKVYRTNPFKADSDGDGVNDGAEVASGADPLVADQAGAGVMLIAILMPEEGAILP